nr:tyrosine-type recombinase/integrase [uncultured Ruminococcus sp.]
MKKLATIEKRNNSYRFIVSCGYDMTGKQIRKTMTWKPEPNMTTKQIEKEVQRQATLFEERCLKGQVLDENIRFAEFAEIWMKDRKNDLRPRTYARYESLLPRINAAIGHIKLCKIQPPHLRAFYANLAESGVRLDTKYTCNISMDDYLRENELTTAALCRRSGISNTTMISIRKGNNVNQQNAEKLAAALEMPLSELFTPVGEGHKTLSGKTIQHYHRLISVILNTAVEWGVLFSNPCERTKTPKAEEKEAKYIDEVQADALISAIETADELHRTIVRLLLFTGMRRGEALGLKWSDIDFKKGTLKICRTIQFLPKRGIFEDKPKNKSSERVIRLPQTTLDDLRAHQVAQMEQRLSLGSYWKGTEDYVFTNPEGKPLKPDSVSSWFSKFMKQHPEIPFITLHSLRHTNATLQLAAGVPITTVSKRLGHSNTATTGRVYAHAIQSADDTAAEKIEDIFSKQKTKAAV